MEEAKRTATADRGSRAYYLFTASLVLFLHFLAYLVLQVTPQSQVRPENWPFQYTVLLLLSVAMAAMLVLRRTRRTNLVVLGLQAIVLIVVNYPNTELPVACLFACVLALELVFWFDFPFWLTCLTTALIAYLLWLRPFPVLNQGVVDITNFYSAHLAILALVALAVALLGRRYRSSVDSLVGAARRITNLNSSMQKLLSANLDFQNYAVRAGRESAQEERKRLTREMHDIVGYALTNLRMMMESAINLAGPNNPALTGLLVEAREEIRSNLAETRRAMRAVRAITDGSPPGIPRLQKLVDSFTHATGIGIEIHYGNIPRSFGPDIDQTVYRIIQEGMINAFIHGHATEILIYFWIHDGVVSLTVDDNGQGAESFTAGIGFSGMNERLESLGGSLRTASSAYGFSLKVKIPFVQGAQPG